MVCKFKVGDVVKCIEIDRYKHLTVGNLYIITGVLYVGEFLELKGFDANEHNFRSNRFEKCKKETRKRKLKSLYK